jgi:nitrogen fixation protein NifU and related proteins
MDRSEILEIILDHYQNPRNYGELEDADISLQGGNPGCGDIITMYLKFKDNRLEEISFTGEGCTISQAAASMLTEIMPGHSIEQIEEMSFHVIESLLGEDLVKTRPKCATLGLDTLKIATQQYHQKKRME